MAEDRSQSFGAYLPLRQEPFPRLSRHPLRVGARVTADHMAAAVQFSNLSGIQKARPADPVRSDEKITGPAIPFQHCGHRRIRAQATLVKSKNQLTARTPGLGDRFQVPAKLLPVELINPRPAPGRPLALESPCSTTSWYMIETASTELPLLLIACWKLFVHSGVIAGTQQIQVRLLGGQANSLADIVQCPAIICLRSPQLRTVLEGLPKFSV